MKKAIYFILSTIFILSLNIIPIQAFNGVPSTTNIMQQLPSKAPRAYVYIVIYQITPDGILQYRTWNETLGFWVEPNWINA